MSNSTTVYGTTGRRRATTDETVVILAGEQGPAGVSYGFHWRGDWDPAATYSTDDAVHGSDGQLYICVVSNSTGEDPTTTPASWDTLVGQLDAIAVSFTPSSGIDSTNVQAAIEEARTDLQDHVNALEPEHTNYQLKIGFPLDENGAYGCTIAYDASNRVVAISPTAPAASFEFWVKGKRFEKIGVQTSPSHADSENGYFVYYDDDGVLHMETTAWDLREHAPVAYIYYRNSTYYVAYEERHTIYRDAGLHAYLHSSMGTQIDSGFALSNYALNSASDADTTPDVASGVIRDEDLKHALSAVAAGAYTRAYRTGVTGAWQFATAQALPYYTGATYVQYNQLTGGSWQLTDLGNNEYVNYYVYLTPALETAKRVLFVPGQAKHATLAAAQAESAISMDLGSILAQEIVAVWKITLLTNAGNGSTGKIQIKEVQRISLSRAAVLTGVSPTVHNSLSGRSDADTHPASAITNTPAGTVAATTVQAAIDEIASDYATADALKVAKAGDTMTGPLLLPDGTVGVPSLSFSNQSNTGLFYAAGSIRSVIAGTAKFHVDLARIRVSSDMSIDWAGGVDAGVSAGDVKLLRDAANVLALRNGVNAQAFRLYNTYTDASNYERGYIQWSGSQLQIGTEALGTGAARALQFKYSSTTTLELGSLYFAPSDASISLGLASARWKAGFFGGAAASVPILIKLHASQTANAFEVQNSNGDAIAKIDKDGKATFANQDTASGFAMLDAGQKVATARLGTGTAGATSVLHGDQTYKYVSRMIRSGGNVPAPVAAKNWHVFRAPVAMTIDAIYAIHVAGTNCTVNVRKNGSSALRSSDYTTTTSWASFGSLQNNTLAAGDYLEIQIVTVTGSVEQVAIQIEGTPTA
jgi:hypothetical protein